MQCYKYTDIQYIQMALNLGIYAGKITDFNDPYEYEGIRYPDDYRVCCLTKSFRKMLMWAYYVKHKGCCIEFNISDECDLIKPVNYTRTFHSHNELAPAEVNESLFRKSKEWKYEQELRIVYYRANHNNDYWIESGDNVYFRAKVKTVTLGLRTDMKDKKLKNILNQISEYNKKTPKRDQIEVRKMMISNIRYELVLDKQFEYERYI